MTQMNYTSTFSMQNILNQPLNPSLCRKILDQIKSPLMQQSFILTNDQSFNYQQTNIPKRPNIPSPQKRKQKNKSVYNCYLYDNNSFDNKQIQSHNSLYETNKFSEIFYNQNKYINNNDMTDMILSPLDPTITQRKQQQQKEDNFNLFQYISKSLYNAILSIKNQNHQNNEQQQYKVFVQPIKRKFHSRKKIFNQQQKKQDSVHKKLSILLDIQKPNKSHIQVKQEQPKQFTAKQTLTQLKNNQHNQIANFIQLCLYIMSQLKITNKQAQFCNRNLAVVYSATTTTSDSIQGVTNIDENIQKALKRMNFKSVSNMLQKFSTNDFINSNNYNFKEYHLMKNKITESIEKIVYSFSNIEKRISLYLSKPNIKQELEKVYKILDEKFRYLPTKNLYQQLQNLFKDIRLDKYIADLQSLSYIWPEFQTDLFSQEQFINGIMRNHAIYKKQQSLFSQQNYGNQFETQLSKMGFSRN